jgi:hypothetical protein
MSHSKSPIIHVANKQAAQDNAVSAEVIQLTTELNEITKSLAAYPSQLGASTLTARKAAIQARLAGIAAEEK